MMNIRLTSIDQYVDVSSKTNYNTYHLRESVEKRLQRIHVSSRDSSRTPMQWDDSAHAGFSTAEPWFFVNSNYKKVNVAAEEKDDDSILNFYRRCIALRKSSETLIYGKYNEFFPKHKELYIYERVLGDERYLIICSFSRLPHRMRIPDAYKGKTGELVLCNYSDKPLKDDWLKPYEARVYKY
jgi:oligo-1,6-glucosidase